MNDRETVQEYIARGGKVCRVQAIEPEVKRVTTPTGTPSCIGVTYWGEFLSCQRVLPKQGVSS